MSEAEPTVEENSEEPQPNIVADWANLRASLPDDIRSEPLLDAYSQGETPSGLEGLVRAHVDVQKLVGGEKVSKPGKDASIQDWSRYYKDLGRPDSPTDYDLGDFKPPEGVPWDETLQNDLMQDLFDAGMTNAQVNTVIRSYAERTGEQYNDAMIQLDDAGNRAAEELKTEWGTAFDANHELSERAFATAFGENIGAVANIPLPDGSLLGDNAIFIRGMYELGSRMQEGSLIDGLPQRGGHTPESAQSEIDTMERDPIQVKILSTRSHPEHKALMAKHTALYKAANPER